MDVDNNELWSNDNWWLWRVIIDDMPHMISVKDAETRRYLFCNPECDKVLGPNAVGRTNFDVLDQHVAERIEAEETALIDVGGVTIVETIVKDREGHSWVMRTKKFLVSKPGGRTYLVTVSEDVSEKHERARQLDEALTAADNANAAKSAFLATVSHEVRTPLNGILGMAQAMAADGLPPEFSDKLRIIQDSGKTLLSILNHILDFSKIEAGKVELEDSEFDLGALISGVYAPFANLAKEKGIGFYLEIDREAEGYYRGDPVRVSQILYNIVSNSVKFTQEGAVRLHASRPQCDLIIHITDTGVGIAQDRVESMFDKFTQADSSTTRHFGGTGLGLSICRELCHLMGGRIGVTSELGKGSVFEVSLPLARLNKTKSVEAPEELNSIGLKSELKVLAAEDNHVNRLVLKTLLNQLGVDPVFVENGVQAVEAWHDNDWDLILMDVNMPVMDGMQACTSIRAKEAELGRSRTPILALTADTMDHQAGRYVLAGMDAHIGKPINMAELIERINAVLPSE